MKHLGTLNSTTFFCTVCGTHPAESPCKSAQPIAEIRRPARPLWIALIVVVGVVVSLFNWAVAK